MVLCSIAIQLYCVLRDSTLDPMASSLLPFVVGGAAFVPLGVWLLSRVSSRLVRHRPRRFPHRLWRE